MYLRHTDVNYMYNVLSHLGLTESLTTVSEKRKSTSKSRNLKEEITNLGQGTYCHLHDNFNKVHTTCDPIFGSAQTQQSEILNRTLVLLPLPKHYTQCTGPCNCKWSQVTPSKEIPFMCIDLNGREISEKKV